MSNYLFTRMGDCRDLTDYRNAKITHVENMIRAGISDPHEFRRFQQKNGKEILNTQWKDLRQKTYYYNYVPLFELPLLASPYEMHREIKNYNNYRATGVTNVKKRDYADYRSYST